MKPLATLVLGLVLLAPAAMAQEADILEGRKIAEEYCARCHDIEPGGKFKSYPPSFRAIAVYMDPEIIRMKIMQPDHNTIMPKYAMFINQTRLWNVVEYILSLETPDE